MRIWHFALLPYLPELQFKGQLREMDCIATSKSRITDDEWKTFIDGYRQIAGEDYVI